MVQTGTFSWSPIVASIPIGIFVGLVLLANNIRDITYDGSVQNRTLAVVLGVNGAARVYSSLLVLAYLLVVAGVFVGLVPVWSLIVFVTVPGARKLAAMFSGEIPDNADPRTAALAFQFAILFMASLVLAIVVPLYIAV